MKTTKLFFALVALMVFSAPLFAQNLNGNGNGGQNGNAVISEVQVYDLGNGTGRIEVRVSGNLANTVTGGSFTLVRVGPGDQPSATGFLVGPENQLGNQSVILIGGFNLAPAFGNGPRFVDLDIQVQGAFFRSKVHIWKADAAATPR